MKKNPYKCILLALESDYRHARNNLINIYERLNPKEIVVIGPSTLLPLIKEDSAATGLGGKLNFLDERELLSYDEVDRNYRNQMEKMCRLHQWREPVIRTGWYYQQFLKMQYSFISEDQYYLSWDIDTLPLVEVEMLHESEKPIFDTKKEYVPTYFKLTEKLFGFGKILDDSFVSEHMLFHTSYMQEMIKEIEGLPVDGKKFYEKIISAIEEPNRGFSEFETYGTWICKRHPSAYVVRDWKSMRNAGLFIEREALTEEDMAYLATGFDAASFEKNQSAIPIFRTLFLDKEYRNGASADAFYEAFLQEGLMGEYTQGGIRVGENIFPV
ncbi:MAG: hypothetical protein K6E75_07625 [Lachnospiraceae bacterium]|nr:hypothetical protein [Lachnospiraceae bacterium]